MLLRRICLPAWAFLSSCFKVLLCVDILECPCSYVFFLGFGAAAAAAAAEACVNILLLVEEVALEFADRFIIFVTLNILIGHSEGKRKRKQSIGY
jgi:hypothetical protein